MSTAPRSGAHGESGWAVFAGVLFALAGIFNAMWGIAALANDDNFAVSQLLFGDLTVWGLVYLILGSAQLVTAWLIGTGRRLGRMLGILIAGLSAINAMFSFGAYPWWSATIMALDILIIYGLAVHGDDYA